MSGELQPATADLIRDLARHLKGIATSLEKWLLSQQPRPQGKEETRPNPRSN